LFRDSKKAPVLTKGAPSMEPHTNERIQSPSLVRIKAKSLEPAVDGAAWTGSCRVSIAWKQLFNLLPALF
jgi:hypothetical protein